MSKYNQPIASLYPDDTFLTAFPAAAAAGGATIDGTLVAITTNYNVTDDTYVTLVDYTGSGWLVGFNMQLAANCVLKFTVDGTASEMVLDNTRDALTRGTGHMHGLSPIMYFASGLEIEAKVTSGAAGGSGNNYVSAIYTTGGSSGTPQIMKYAYNTSVNTVADTYEDILNVTTSGALLLTGFMSQNRSEQVHLKYTWDGATAYEMDFGAANHFDDLDRGYYNVGHTHLPFSDSMRVEGKDDTSAFSVKYLNAACLYLEDV